MLQFFNNNRETLANMLHEKNTRHCKIQDAKRLKRKPSFGKFRADFQRQPLTDVFLNTMFLKISQYWSLFLIKTLLGLLFRTPTVAASGFSLQQIPFSAKTGLYRRHRFLSWTPLKTRVKPQKQPLQLFFKIVFLEIL